MNTITPIIEESRAVAADRNQRDSLVLPNGFIIRDGDCFVLDGNVVRAWHVIDEEGVPVWLLETGDPGTWFLIRANGHVWLCERDIGGYLAEVREIEDASQTAYTLEEAVRICEQRGHRWSPHQTETAPCDGRSIWQSCVTCGAERSLVPDTDAVLEWPAEVLAFELQAAEPLPSLHGALLRPWRRI